MNNIQIIGYKRIEAGKIGGAFKRAEEVMTSSQGVAVAVNAMLSALGASSKIVIQTSADVIAIAPEHDEAIHGFESNPFQIYVKPLIGTARFTGEARSMVVSLEETGAAVEKLAA